MEQLTDTASQIRRVREANDWLNQHTDIMHKHDMAATFDRTNSTLVSVLLTKPDSKTAVPLRASFVSVGDSEVFHFINPVGFTVTKVEGIGPILLNAVGGTEDLMIDPKNVGRFDLNYGDAVALYSDSISNFVAEEKRLAILGRNDLTSQQKAAMLVEEAHEEAMREGREPDDSTVVLAFAPKPSEALNKWQRLVNLYSPD